jgi:hypothetical protein
MTKQRLFHAVLPLSCQSHLAGRPFNQLHKVLNQGITLILKIVDIKRLKPSMISFVEMTSEHFYREDQEGAYPLSLKPVLILFYLYNGFNDLCDL